MHHTPQDTHNGIQPSPHSPPLPAYKKHSRKRRNQQDYQHWLYGPLNTVRGETALWTAVITQAMMDALSQSMNPENIYHKHEAICWLTSNSRDFNMVCLFAGLEPDYVRQRAKRTLANPLRWRAEAGKGSRYEERKAYRQRLKRQKALANPSPEPSTNDNTIITGCWSI